MKMADFWRSSIINLRVYHHLLMELSVGWQAGSDQILQHMHCCCQISFCKQINQMSLKYRFRPASCFCAKCFNLDDRCMKGETALEEMHLCPANSYSQTFASRYQRQFFVELSCPRQKEDIRTTNCFANFAIRIDIDIESLLRLVGCIDLIISYHWIDYERQSWETKNLNFFRFALFEIFRFAKKKTRFAISLDHWYDLPLTCQYSIDFSGKVALNSCFTEKVKIFRA